MNGVLEEVRRRVQQASTATTAATGDPLNGIPKPVRCAAERLN